MTRFVKLNVGVPIKMLHESVGFTCTIETKNGALYRGLVINVEDCFNIQMKNVKVTDKHGQKSTVDNAYVRGSQVVYVVLPDMLRNSANLQPRVLQTNKDEVKTEDAQQQQTKRQKTN